MEGRGGGGGWGGGGVRARENVELFMPCHRSELITPGAVRA